MVYVKKKKTLERENTYLGGMSMTIFYKKLLNIIILDLDE